MTLTRREALRTAMIAAAAVCAAPLADGLLHETAAAAATLTPTGPATTAAIPSSAGTANTLGSGLLSARPDPSTVAQGSLYFATDANGGTVYFSDGVSQWTAMSPGIAQYGGRVLASAVAAAVSVAGPVNSTAWVPIPGATVTVAVGARPIIVEWAASPVSTTIANGTPVLGLFEGTTLIDSVGQTVPAPYCWATLGWSNDLNPTVGAHTYSLQLSSARAAVGSCAYLVGKAQIRVVEG